MKTPQTTITLLASIVLMIAVGCDTDTDKSVAEQNTQVLQCSVEPNICTRDLNECDNPSSCTCPEGYSYNGAIAECLYDFGVTDDIEQATTGSFESADESSNLQCVLPAGGTCTRDINDCGNPSQCGCPDGYAYNAAINKCLLILR